MSFSTVFVFAALVRFCPKFWKRKIPTNKLPGLRSCSPLLIYVIFTVIDFETMSSKQYFSPDCQNEGEDGKNGKDYEGNVAKTVSGYKCQKWSEQKPHKHKFADQGKHNFCRNPDGHKGVWCYTTARKRWEECDVPVCPPPPVKDIGQNIFVLIYILYIPRASVSSVPSVSSSSSQTHRSEHFCPHLHPLRP